MTGEVAAPPAWLRFVGADFSELPDAAVVVAPPDAGHVGVACRDDAGAVRWVHLAFHHRLRREELPTGHAWIAAPLEPERLASVAAMCERVWKRHGKSIPYGFRYDATRFARDGALVLGADERGLTCATFVLAIYRSVGVELLRDEPWPDRADDRERFLALLEVLRAHCDDAAHVAAVAGEVGSTRVRPAEVAGASSSPPCAFAQAVAAAQEITSALAPPLPVRQER